MPGIKSRTVFSFENLFASTYSYSSIPRLHVVKQGGKISRETG